MSIYLGNNQKTVCFFRKRKPICKVAKLRSTTKSLEYKDFPCSLQLCNFANRKF